MNSKKYIWVGIIILIIIILITVFINYNNIRNQEIVKENGHEIAYSLHLGQIENKQIIKINGFYE